MVSFGAIAKRPPPGGAEWPYSSEICCLDNWLLIPVTIPLLI